MSKLKLSILTTVASVLALTGCDGKKPTAVTETDAVAKSDTKVEIKKEKPAAVKPEAHTDVKPDANAEDKTEKHEDAKPETDAVVKK